MTTYTCTTCNRELDSTRFQWQRQAKNGKLYRLHSCKTCRSRRAYQKRRDNPVRYANFLAYQRERYRQGKRMPRGKRNSGKRAALTRTLAKHGLLDGS